MPGTTAINRSVREVRSPRELTNKLSCRRWVDDNLAWADYHENVRPLVNSLTSVLDRYPRFAVVADEAGPEFSISKIKHMSAWAKNIQAGKFPTGKWPQSTSRHCVSTRKLLQAIDPKALIKASQFESALENRLLSDIYASRLDRKEVSSLKSPRAEDWQRVWLQARRSFALPEGELVDSFVPRGLFDSAQAGDWSVGDFEILVKDACAIRALFPSFFTELSAAFSHDRGAFSILRELHEGWSNRQSHQHDFLRMLKSYDVSSSPSYIYTCRAFGRVAMLVPDICAAIANLGNHNGTTHN